MWIAEHRRTGAGPAAEWVACGRASRTIKAAKSDARGSVVASQEQDFRIRTTRGEVYQVATAVGSAKIRWRLPPDIAEGALWHAEYRAPGEDWLKVGTGRAIEAAAAAAHDWHSHSVHSGGTFRVVQSDARGSIWMESHPPHAKQLAWEFPR